MSESEVSDVNLSEILFKPRHNYIETSLISNSGCPLPENKDGKYLMGSRFRSLWYRPLNLFSWSALGANNLDVEEALANIVASNNARTREECFDTVEQYGPGNWIYEFCNIAQRRVMLARQLEKEQSKPEIISHQYRMASRYFAIAAYPDLKGDVLADQATLLGAQTYRKIFNDPKTAGIYKEEKFTVHGTQLTGALHSPDSTDVHPCVIVISAYNSTKTDYHRLFSHYLSKLGIALFAIEMPGMGSASNIILDAQTSDILEAAIDHLSSVPFIDTTRLGAVGFRSSSNAVVRYCLMHPHTLKSIVIISPSIHNLYVDQEVLNVMPLCTRSSLANRMNLDASHWDTIVPQLQVLSLKKQGLTGHSLPSSLKCLSLYLPIDLKYHNDMDLISRLFPGETQVIFKSMRVGDYNNVVYAKASDFFKDHLL